LRIDSACVLVIVSAATAAVDVRGPADVSLWALRRSSPSPHTHTHTRGLPRHAHTSNHSNVARSLRPAHIQATDAVPIDGFRHVFILEMMFVSRYSNVAVVFRVATPGTARYYRSL
jgi:hypothetical protein